MDSPLWKLINAVLAKQKPQDPMVAQYIPFESMRRIHKTFSVPGQSSEVIQMMLEMPGISVSVESEELNNAFINLALQA